MEREAYRSVICLIFLLSPLYADKASPIHGCSIASILKKIPPPFKIREESKGASKELDKGLSLKITQALISMEISKQKKEFHSQNRVNPIPLYPPLTIQPMYIKGVTTVGELEVLSFIKALEKEDTNLLIDVRSNKKYKQKTIPKAINIPYRMLTDKSKYQQEVIKLLGGEQSKQGWRFKFPSSLLIFGESEKTAEASEAIKTLLKLSYPPEKILFYRAGIENWNRLGLMIE